MSTTCKGLFSNIFSYDFTRFSPTRLSTATLSTASKRSTDFSREETSLESQESLAEATLVNSPFPLSSCSFFHLVCTCFQANRLVWRIKRQDTERDISISLWITQLDKSSWLVRASSLTSVSSSTTVVTSKSRLLWWTWSQEVQQVKN